MSCIKHKDVPTTVQTTAGPRCAWCEVGELRLKLLRSNERETALEMENAKLQVELDRLRVRIEGAAGLAVVRR